MTVEVERRGSLRPISDLPALVTPVSPLVEVEDSGAFYQAAYGAGGSSYPPWSQVAFSTPLATAFTDLKGHAFKTVGTAPTFAGNKAVFGGAGCVIYNLLQQTNGEDLQLRNMPFTLEGWFSCTSAAGDQGLVTTNINNTGGYILVMNQGGTSGKLAWAVNGGSVLVIMFVSGVPHDGSRHHVAVVNVTPLLSYLCLDGVVVAVTTTTPSLLGDPASAPLCLGGAVTGSFAAPSGVTDGLVGTMDNWRFTKGVALYPGVNFTVPTPPFPTA